MKYQCGGKLIKSVLALAKNCCESCGSPPAFKTVDGSTTFTMYHICTIKEGETYTVNNTVAVCSNCYDELIQGEHSESKHDALYENIARLVD